MFSKISGGREELVATAGGTALTQCGDGDRL